jgi:thioredoxin reductase
MGVEQTSESISAFDYRTALPNVFMVGDTVTGAGLAAVSRFAEDFSNHLTN